MKILFSDVVASYVFITCCQNIAIDLFATKFTLPHHTINAFTTLNTHTVGCAPPSVSYCHQI